MITKCNLQILLFFLLMSLIFTGIITVINLQKLMEVRTHLLNVSVSDGVYTSFTRVRVELTPANQHSPIFEKHQYDARIGENLPASTKIIKVTALDKDAGAYGQISYSIPSQLLSESFYISNLTGELLFVYEHFELYCIHFWL